MRDNSWKILALLRPNRFILVRELVIRRSEPKITKRFRFARWIKIFFYFWFTLANHFIFDSQFILITIHFDLRFELILFILIRFNFDSTPIMIHLRIKIKSNKKSQEGESWFTYLWIIAWFDFESKANQSESRFQLIRAPLPVVFKFSIQRLNEIFVRDNTLS